MHRLIPAFLPVCDSISSDSDDSGNFSLKKAKVESPCSDMITKSLKLLRILGRRRLFRDQIHRWQNGNETMKLRRLVEHENI